MKVLGHKLHQRDRILSPVSSPAGPIVLADQKLASAAQATAIGVAVRGGQDSTEDSVVELFLLHTRNRVLLFLGLV